MIVKKCKNCGGEFKVYPCVINRAKFCSKKCKNIWQKGKHYSPKTEFKKGICPPTRFKKGQNLGDKHPNWKGGKKTMSSGHIYIHSATHPFATKEKYVRHSRLTAEKCLGRYLTRKEVIHHINGIKDDDRPENLYLFPKNGAHMKYHSSKIKPKLTSNLL